MRERDLFVYSDTINNNSLFTILDNYLMSYGPVRPFQLAYCLSGQAHFAWFIFGGTSGAEDDLRLKTTFGGRRPLMEDNLWWKTTFDGRRNLMEDNLPWKMIIDGRWPLKEDKLWWKATFDGRCLWWKITFDGKWPLMEDNLCWKTS